MSWCSDRCVIRKVHIDKKNFLIVTISKNCKCEVSEKDPDRVVRLI